MYNVPHKRLKQRACYCLVPADGLCFQVTTTENLGLTALVLVNASTAIFCGLQKGGLRLLPFGFACLEYCIFHRYNCTKAPIQFISLCLTEGKTSRFMTNRSKVEQLSKAITKLVFLQRNISGANRSDRKSV
jgi:hypothetical protein